MRDAHTRTLRLWVAAIYIIAAVGATFLHTHVHHAPDPGAAITLHHQDHTDAYSPSGGPCPACFFQTINLTDRDNQTLTHFAIVICGQSAQPVDAPHTISVQRSASGRAPPTPATRHI